MEKRTNVTLYRAQFAGIFGRNRNVKLSHSDPVEIGPDQGFVTAESLAQSHARKIGAKRGTLRVESIEGCEVQTHPSPIKGETVTMHIVPIFSGGGAEVYRIEIGGGV